MLYSAATLLLRRLPVALFLLFPLLGAEPARALEKATLQLKWHHHFQFAGYYAALEKGFYQKAGLDVAIVEGGPSTEVEKEVLSGRADFGVGTSSILLHRGRGEDLVVLAQIFQHSPVIFLTPRKTGIRSPAQMRGRRFMYSKQHDTMILLKKNGIREEDIVQVPHQGDPRDLISGKAEVMIAYNFNEPYILEQAGEPYLTFSPYSYGVDFYGDNIFTTGESIEKRPGYVAAFREATLAGWRYALAHKAEIADLIRSRYSREKSREWLIFEANQMETLIQPTLVEMGYQSPSRWRQIGAEFVGLGMLPREFDPSGIVYTPSARKDYRLLAGTILFSGTAIGILTVIALTFRRLNRSLLAEVTERKHAEQAFKESEERLRVIIETSHAGIVMVEPEGTISFANNRMAEMLGYPLEQIVGSRYHDHIDPEESEGTRALMLRLMKGEIDYVLTERHYLRSDGSDFWGYLSGRRLETAEGELKGLVGIVADSSDRKKAEEARRKALMFIETLLGQSPMGIRVFDGESGNCVRANQAVADITGATMEDLLGQNFRELFSWRETGLTAAAEKVLADGVARPMEATLQIVPGKKFTARYFLSRFVVEEKAHLLVLGQDITEETRLEKENRRIEAQMLNMQKLESLGVLAGGIAHDFNNILTGIMGNVSFARMLLEGSHQAQGPLLKAEKASQRAAELAAQLLTFSKGGQPVKKAFSVQTLVRESVSLVLRGTNIRSVLEVPDAVIEADEGQINQAFNNIIINAVHAMPDGGTLTIRGERGAFASGNRLGLEPGEYVWLSFTDEGCGISEADLEKIFDPYFTTKSSGTGLGLASTHSIISRHGGMIRVDSAPGLGSSFTIYLPAAVGLPPAESPERHPSPPPRGGGSVLVMDDEEAIRDLTTGVLVELGYRVQSCSDGEEAVELYLAAQRAGSPFSAVIMDLTVPGGMGGKQAAQRIVELDPRARLIVSSGYSNDPVVAEYRGFGFRARLVKPYGAAEIARALHESLDGGASRPFP